MNQQERGENSSLLLKEKYQYKLTLSFQSYLYLNATEVINLPTF